MKFCVFCQIVSNVWQLFLVQKSGFRSVFELMKLPDDQMGQLLIINTNNKLLIPYGLSESK